MRNAVSNQPIFIQNEPGCNSRENNIEVAELSRSKERQLRDDQKHDDAVIEMMELHAVDDGIWIMDEDRKARDDDGRDNRDAEKSNPMMGFVSFCFFDESCHANSISFSTNFGETRDRY